MQLNNKAKFAQGVLTPGYTPEQHGPGIVHFGVGAFHRSHQAVFTDDVLALHGGDWRIIGVSLQSTAIADVINQQDGLYSLLTRSSDESSTTVRIIGSIHHVEAATRTCEGVYAALADADTKIVTMTVTEKAYGINRSNGFVDTSNAVMAADLDNPDEPSGLIGMLVKGLSLRKEKALPPFTVLCCDNLPNNGDLIRKGVLDYARRTDSSLADWLSANGAFPNTMVDRITPATTPELKSEVASALSVSDEACVEAEEFSQWVIEDNFTCGRPRWEDVGVIFVGEVAPYEKMKLRMLNGAHSLIAYLGYLCGFRYVRDAMASQPMKRLVESHIHSAALTLPELPGIDFDDYGSDLVSRFSNPNIAHETYQIAMDGSQKMPQRIFEPALETLHCELPIDTYAIATAAWLRYCSGTDASGEKYEIRDPMQKELAAALVTATRSGSTEQSAEAICKNVLSIPGLGAKSLAENEFWIQRTSVYLELMLENDFEAALALFNDQA